MDKNGFLGLFPQKPEKIKKHCNPDIQKDCSVFIIYAAESGFFLPFAKQPFPYLFFLPQAEVSISMVAFCSSHAISKPTKDDKSRNL